MQKSIRRKIEEFDTEHKRKRSWKKFLISLAAIVVFCTTYALILPAITMEKSICCDKPEHTHGESCYEETVIPAGDVLACTDSAHSHTAECYSHVEEHTEKVLICTMEEHTHSGSCYDAPAPEDKSICGMGVHMHSEKCFDVKTGRLVCTIPEHIHADLCYSAEKKTDVQILEGMFADYTAGENLRENILALAQRQVSFRPAENGTPYDAWAGENASDWNLSFALYTAAKGGMADPTRYSTAKAWAEALNERNVVYDARSSDHNEQPGDLFFTEGRVGILSGVSKNGYLVIEGGSGGAVQTVFYPVNSELIFGIADSEALGDAVKPEDDANVLLPMMLASAPAPVQESNNNIKIRKSVSGMNEDGSYDLTLEAWSQGAGKPLDIVMVIDVSGSMESGVLIPSDVKPYTTLKISSATVGYEVDNWDLDTDEEYYVYHKDELVRMYFDMYDGGWHIGLEHEHDSFASALNSYNGDPVYYGEPEGTVKKIDAVKKLAKDYVDDISADAKLRGAAHQISVVQFNASAKTLCSYQNLLSEKDYSTVISTINGLEAGGKTYSAAALEKAYKLLYTDPGIEAYKEHAKIVIFITDGDMTSSSDFNNAIGYANSVKNNGGYVYSLGVYGTDPSKSIKQFLYCVSSENTTISRYSDVKNYPTGKYYALATDTKAVADAEDSILAVSMEISNILSENSVLHDALGDAFIHNDGLTVLSKKLIPATGTGSEPTWDVSKAADASAVTVTADASGTGFSIKGFDYDDNANITAKNKDGNWTGNKLSVTVRIKPDPSTEWNSTVTAYDTNASGSVYLTESDGMTKAAEMNVSPKVDAKALTYIDGESSDTVYVLPGTPLEVRDAPDNDDFIDWKSGETTYDPGELFMMPNEDKTFTAEYKEPEVITHLVTVKKQVDGVTTDNKFDFIVTVSSGSVSVAEGYAGVYRIDGAELRFSLANGESIPIVVTDGTTIVISEPAHNGYYVKYFDKTTYENGDTRTLSEIKGNLDITVINTAGAELPSTGGIGKEAIYVIGIMLITGAVVYSCSPRRKREGGRN